MKQYLIFNSILDMKKSLLTALAGIVLATPMFAQNDDYRLSQDLTPYGEYEQSDDVRSARVPLNIAEVVAAMPAMPTVEQVCSPEAKSRVYAATYQPFAMAMEQTIARALDEGASIQQRITRAGQKQHRQNMQTMQQYQSNVNAGLVPSQEEIMQLYMSGEIKDNMSEAQMMDVMAGKFAQKWGISKQEYIKILNMAQSNPKQTETYIKANHPDLYNRLYAANAQYGDQNVRPDDPRDAQFDRIYESLAQLQEQLQQVTFNYRGDATAGIGTQLDELSREQANEWKTSSEARQIDAIEADLNKRLESWSAGLRSSADRVSYPDWWTAGRKQINGIIDQWNKRSAQRWLKLAQNGESQYRTICTKIAALETENEQLGQQGDPENMKYLMNKQRLSVIYGMLYNLTLPYRDALAFPCIQHVDETGYATFGKG